MTEETATDETATDTAGESTETTETTAPAETTPKSSDFNWRDDIEDADVMKQAERYDTAEKAVQATLDLRKKLSKAVVIPTRDSDDVEISTFRKNMGIPENADEYQFENLVIDENTPEAQKESLSKWQQLFHEENIPAKSAQRMEAMFRAEQMAQIDADKALDVEFAQQTEAKLREQWGAEYDKNKEYASRAATDLMGGDFDSAKQIELKDGRFMMDHPIMVKMLAQMGREMGEGRIGSVLTDSEASTLQEKANEYREKRMQALENKRHDEARKWDAKEREALARLEG